MTFRHVKFCNKLCQKLRNRNKVDFFTWQSKSNFITIYFKLLCSRLSVFAKWPVVVWWVQIDITNHELYNGKPNLGWLS